MQVLHWDSAPPTGANDFYRYSHTDHLGSTSLELGEDARTISQETVHPFGETAWSKDSEVSYKTFVIRVKNGMRLPREHVQRV